VKNPKKKVAVAGLLLLALALILPAMRTRAQNEAPRAIPSSAAAIPPPWAYGFAVPPGVPSASNGTPANAETSSVAAAQAAAALHRLPGSKLAFTLAQISDSFAPADWYPEDHPPMPPIVAHGKAPEVMACALCHYPNGRGRPENAAVAGLPKNYIVAQLQHFRRDERRSADPRKANTAFMVQVAKGMSDEEMEQAANYFSQLKFPRWIRVVESDSVPKTEISGGMFVPIAQAPREPIGMRIIEMPEDRTAVETLRNPRVGFVAYVPRGAIRRGEAIVMRGGNGKTPLPCTNCHGADLRGVLDIPPLAGRSPSYIARALFDMQSGTRIGTGVDLMKPIVTKLDDQDLLDIAAFLASRSP